MIWNVLTNRLVKQNQTKKKKKKIKQKKQNQKQIVQKKKKPVFSAIHTVDEQIQKD